MAPALCILAGGKMLVLAGASFTLGWTHSVQKTEWLETWHVEPAGLHLVEARIKGSGAGMDPPGDAVLKGGWWIYRPRLAPRPSLVLAASGATGSGWRLCMADDCRELGDEPGDPIRLEACEAG
jgi:hypothetical protein